MSFVDVYRFTGQRICPIGETNIDINGHIIRFQITEDGSSILGKDVCEAKFDSTSEYFQYQRSG